MSISNNQSQKLKFEKIKNLVSTYSQAIEYYQSIESDLYVDLNLRMQNLLTKPETLEMLDKEAELKKNASPSPVRISDKDLLPKPRDSKIISPKKAHQI